MRSLLTWAGFIYSTVLGLEFVYLGRFYLQYSLGFGVCLPGQVLFTIQSWVWSLFTWAHLIYNTVLGLEFVYLGMSYLQYSLGVGVCLPGQVLFTIQSWEETQGRIRACTSYDI